MTPDVTVVIPTYNRALDLERCLRSIKLQTFKNFEVIVCDDGSTDNTADIVEKNKSYLNLQYFWFENFGGPARGRNVGIEKSKGKYIAFLDSDDWWTSDKLEKSIKYLDNGADLVYHDLWLYGINGIPFFFRKARTRVLKSPIKKDLLLNGNALNNSSVIVRKSIIEKVGLLSEDINLIAGEDFDFWIRISEVTEKFIRIPTCLGYYWIGGGNISDPQKSLLIFKEIQRRYLSFFETLTNNGLFPSWLYYGILASLIETKEFEIKDFIKFRKKMNLKHNIKLLIKFILSVLKF
jgi:glycosyltransferase involved in cell wall biosynthesis